MADRPMALSSHLAELRRRLLITVIAFVAGVVLSLLFYERIFDVLIWPAEDPRLYAYTLTGVIGPVMKVSILGGFILALPVAVHQLVRFIAPGLTQKERRYLYVLLPGVALCFAAGVVFAYLVLIPPMIDFLLDFGSDIATVQPSLSSYIGTVTALLFWVGVAFETPFLMYFLTVIGVVTPSFFARHWRAWVLISFVLGAVITPTFDPVNQTLVAGPLIVLYGIGLGVSWLVSRKPRRQAGLVAQAGKVEG